LRGKLILNLAEARWCDFALRVIGFVRYYVSSVLSFQDLIDFSKELESSFQRALGDFMTPTLAPFGPVADRLFFQVAENP